MADVDEIVSAVASSKKYAAICPDTVAAVAARALSAHPHAGTKALVKATKSRLHQIYGAFELDVDYKAVYQKLEAAYLTGLESEIKAACGALLSTHSSTRERLPVLESFYPRLFEITGRPASVLDLACGLNPLSLPWMGLQPGARYEAFDITAGGVQLLNRFLPLAGHEPLAHWQDVLAQPPDRPADVALLLKASTTLERQEKGGTARLLDALRAPFVIVSFAVKSLGGREKGMPAQYREQFRALMAGRPWPVEELVFETELAFVVEKPLG